MLKSWRHSGFNVHCGERIWHDDETAMENIARYISGTAKGMGTIDTKDLRG
jgi:hypothetical protein